MISVLNGEGRIFSSDIIPIDVFKNGKSHLSVYHIGSGQNIVGNANYSDKNLTAVISDTSYGVEIFAR